MSNDTPEPTTYINTHDRARIRRAFASMRFAGGLKICTADPKTISIDELMEALGELSGRLVGAASVMESDRRRFEEHERMFAALGNLWTEVTRAARVPGEDAPRMCAYCDTTVASRHRMTEHLRIHHGFVPTRKAHPTDE